MKKYILVFSVVVLGFGFPATVSAGDPVPGLDINIEQIPGGTVKNTQTDAKEDVITTADLGVENPGILPTSGFYFLKEWRRGITRVFTFNSVTKAELELKITNEKAAELKEVSKSNADGKGLERAIANYKNNAERLRARFEALKETSENPNVDKLLDKLADRTLKHEQLFEELKAKHAGLRERIEDAKENLEETAADAAERLDTAEKLKERFEKAVLNQRERNVKEIRAIGVLDKIEERVKNDEVRVKISEVKDGLIKKFDARVTSRLVAPSAVPELLENLPITEAQKLRILEQVKERTGNTEVKVQLENIEGRVKGDARKANTAGTKPRACTKEAKQCPDGSFVSRTSPHCEFSKCPASGVRNVLPKTIIPELKVEVPSVTTVPVARKWSVEIKDGRFIPSELKIKKGDTVIWTNRDSSQTWPASAIHPTHQVYPGFDALKGLDTGEGYTFTFDKVGSWKYHNHLNPSATGVIRVTE